MAGVAPSGLALGCGAHKWPLTLPKPNISL